MERIRATCDEMTAEKQILEARLMAQKAMKGDVSAEEIEAMTEKASFDDLEKELEAFVGLYERVWKETKRKIRKDLLNLKYIKGQSGKR